jgi:hypothetical protein
VLFNPPQTSNKLVGIPNLDVGTHPIFAPRSHDITHHPEPPQQEPAHQMVSFNNDLTQIESSRPPNWDTFTRNQKAHWRKRILKTNKNKANRF